MQQVQQGKTREVCAADGHQAGAPLSGEAHTRLINLSGRRRFLSQRVVLYALLAAQGRAAALSVSRQALEMFDAAHGALVDPGGRGGPGVFCAELQEAYFGRTGGDATIRGFAELARRTQDAIERASPAAAPLLESLVDATTPLLAVLNAVTQLYEELASRQTAEVKRLLGGVMGEIDSIARQARIVSVNARVAAARAGSGGREFAVVAGELTQMTGRIDELVREAVALSAP